MRRIRRIQDRNLKFRRHIELSPLKVGNSKTPSIMTSYFEWLKANPVAFTFEGAPPTLPGPAERNEGSSHGAETTDCCTKRILNLQPNFKAQKSLAQGVIEEAGHLCIFLPKFHRELNFIEFFWGAKKHYLQENCDYTFLTLQENMPKALASASVELIRKWEHWMRQWMEAYSSGLDVKSAQPQVNTQSVTSLIAALLIPW
ncbi:hypothetical protein AX16_001301 [Volvariella volvacea WC 439]|nr:hypothetical protein AX16_001301 [Volvariella volvacea WC 439]